MDKKLAGKTALVTGANGAIAAAAARRLLEDGAAVVLMSRGRDKLEAGRAKLLAAVPGGEVEIVAGDAGVTADVQAAMAHARDIAGRLDIVVATVGEGLFRPLLMHDLDTFKAQVDSNLHTTFLAIRYGAPLMTAGGSIVCISTTAAKLVLPWMSAYSAAKAGMEALVRSAAEELSPAGIRVNAVRPGMTHTAAMEGAVNDPTLSTQILNEIPLSRWGQPDDIAEAVRYLAGPESSWVTGQIFSVDGGMELRRNPNMSSVLPYIYGEAAAEAVTHGREPPKETA